MTSAQQYCKDKVAASGSNFYYSFIFLPPDQRAAITAIYAFCREVDDIVDDCNEVNVAEQKLLWWQTEIERVFNGKPQHPVAIALQTAVEKFKLPEICFTEILQGMHMDLRYQGYQTFADLQLYCHCVASSVGVLAATVFGQPNTHTLEYARKLGLALQLVNIIRDIGEDARRGRVYLAEDDLAEFGVTSNEILQLKIQDPTRFKALLNKYAQTARQFYAEALSLLPTDQRPAQRSGLIMAKIYFSILSEIQNSAFAVLNQKISITPLRKLWIAWRTWQTEKKLCRAL